MAPWEELKYFRSPVVSGFPGPTGTRLSVAKANPNRIAIMFRMGVAGQTATVSLAGTDTLGNAFVNFIVTDSSPWEIRHKEWPGLPQQEWFATVAAVSNLSVIEIIMTDYPVEPLPDALVDAG